jgi:DNA-directed RNA polymerase subunit alpha
MEKDVELHIELYINKGRGYVPAEENKPFDAEFGLIPIDSIFTPIINVKYTLKITV